MTTEKRKKYKRKDRLKAAEKFLKTFTGKNLVEGYSEWFGTNKVCAIQELQILGKKIDQDYRLRVCREHELKCKAAKEQKSKKNDDVLLDPVQNGEFYYIAGYTSGGAPYGITWEQYEKEIREEHESSDSEILEDDLDEEIPF